MKSRILIEMMSALAIVLLTTLPPQTFGQGSSFGEMGMSGISGSADMDQITRPPLSYTVDDKPYLATRVRSFRYLYQSFRPKELTYVNTNGPMSGGMGSGGMGMGGPGMGGSGGEGGFSGGSSAGIGSSDGSVRVGAGMPGGFGSEGGYPGGFGYGGLGSVVDVAGSSSGYGSSSSDRASDRLTIIIHTYLFDGEKRNDRTRIELMIEQPNEMGMDGMSAAGGMPGGYSEGGSGMGMGMPFEPLRVKLFASLGTSKTKASAKLSQSEIKLVTDIICQTIWKADVVKALFVSKGQGESAAENEKFLKQLLAEQYDTQLARQEMEAESIKQRLELLLDELKRRKVAKDRVVEVQLGRLILDAQGLLNNDR